ncbi:hypothetical protein GIB67_032541 [Kingdonia uniflora]|uniref:Uncharacterized protein n=1 Tax=Kingdonia uniflora TaxID=39325 RepID=A0A7J7L7P2_9MAGN|nr:hypothetical protein GIB67_032541 [Kingdonia uniflora]
MYLSLPLPSTVTLEIAVTAFYGNGTALPMPFTITVLKDSSCKDLLEALSAECYLRSGKTLLLAEVHAHSIYRYLENPSEELFKIKNVDYLVAYRLSKNHEVSTKLEIVHYIKDKFASEIFGSYSKENAGTLLVTYFKEGLLTREDVQNAVQMMLKPLLKLKPDHPLKQVLSSKDIGPALRVYVDPLIGNCDTQSADEIELDRRGLVTPRLCVSSVACAKLEFKLVRASWYQSDLVETDPVAMAEGPNATDPAQVLAPHVGGPPANPRPLNTQTRLDQLEEKMQALSGIIDQVTTLEERLDGFSDDQAHMGERLVSLGVVKGNMATLLD